MCNVSQRVFEIISSEAARVGQRDSNKVNIETYVDTMFGFLQDFFFGQAGRHVSVVPQLSVDVHGGSWLVSPLAA